MQAQMWYNIHVKTNRKALKIKESEVPSMRKYAIGIDIGTKAVGWSVTDADGRLIRHGENHLWGTSMFDEAESAQTRRTTRQLRRNKERRRIRIKQLQNLLAEEVLNADPEFYLRLEETGYQAIDRLKSHVYKTLPEAVFQDRPEIRYDMVNGHADIYALRKMLLETQEKADIRYVYLALAHILKHRGHFLETTYKDICKEDAIVAVKNAVDQINSMNGSRLEADSKLIAAVLDNEEPGTQPTKKAQKIFDALYRLVDGQEVLLGELTGEKKSVRLSFEAMEDNAILDGLNDETEDLIQELRIAYRWKADRKEEQEPGISEQMLKRHEMHKQDLKTLKAWVRQYCKRAEYDRMFHSDEEAVNYNAYTHSRTNKADYEGKTWNHCTQEQLYAKIRSLILAHPNGNQEGNKILSKMYAPNGLIIHNGFLPLQRIGGNRMSNRAQMQEMLGILNNQAPYHESIAKNKDKILAICGFRIPFYVGPLHQDSKSPFEAWIRFKGEKNGHIMPWEFEDKVDLIATSEAYIEQKQNTCTFIPTENVLPKHSLLYEEFSVLNELNRVRVNRRFLKPEVKKRAMDELFAKYKTVTPTLLANWLKKQPEYAKKDSIRVMTKGQEAKKRFVSRLKARQDLEKIFGRTIDSTDPDFETFEEIIRWATVFTDREFYKRKIDTLSEQFTEQEREQLKRLHYTGWGRLSKRLLTEQLCELGGEKASVMHVMRETSCHFMRVYNRKEYKLKENLEKLNRKVNADTLTYEAVQALKCSPKLKRGIWQTIRIIEEIIGVMGGKPAAIYIRNTRESNAKRKKTDLRDKTRYDMLRSQFANYEEDTGKKIPEDLRAELESCKRGMSDLQYLYFTQLGCCMYTGARLDLSKPGTYQTDFIVPLALTPDESNNNRVLIGAGVMARHGLQAMPHTIVKSMNAFWQDLHESGLITGVKYGKLTTTVYNEAELAAQVDSQLTAKTHLITTVTDLIGNHYPGTHVYGINAALTEKIRRACDVLTIRDINDMLPAQNAFTTAFIGTFADKYLRKVTNEKDWHRVVLRVWENAGRTDKNGIIMTAFGKDQEDETLGRSEWSGADARKAYIRKVCGWHDAYMTFKVTTNWGKFYWDTICRAGKGGYIPLNEKMQDTDRYGNRTNASMAYMAVISYVRNGKTEKEIINIPVYAAYRIRKDKTYLARYIAEAGYTEAAGYKNVKVVKDRIGLNQEVEIQGHPFYLHSATELVNAKQAFIPEKYTKAIWMAKHLRPENVAEQIDNDKIADEDITNALAYVADNLKKRFDIYPRLTAGIESLKDKFAEMSLQDRMLLIEIITDSMTTHNIRISPLIKQLEEKNRFNAETRLYNKRVTGETICLVNKSVTGLFTHKQLV